MYNNGFFVVTRVGLGKETRFEDQKLRAVGENGNHNSGLLALVNKCGTSQQARLV